MGDSAPLAAVRRTFFLSGTSRPGHGGAGRVSTETLMPRRKKAQTPRKPPATDLESPWLAEREALTASAREINPLTNSLGLKFREIQQEAAEEYLAADKPSEAAVPTDRSAKS